MKAAGLETQKRGIYLAKLASSGPYSYAALAVMGHPYSKRSPNPPMDSGILNVQSRRLFRAWVGRHPKTYLWRVVNTSPEAQEIEERRNPYMIERDTRGYVQGHLKPVFLKIVREANRRVWTS